MIKKKYSHRTIQDEKIQKLYLAAKAVAVPQVISEQMCSGGVGAAVCSKQGRIFTGVCVDTDCSLGMCAERNALSTMITAGEFDVDMVIAVNKNGKDVIKYKSVAALRRLPRIYGAIQSCKRYTSGGG